MAKFLRTVRHVDRRVPSRACGLDSTPFTGARAQFDADDADRIPAQRRAARSVLLVDRRDAGAGYDGATRLRLANGRVAHRRRHRHRSSRPGHGGLARRGFRTSINKSRRARATARPRSWSCGTTRADSTITRRRRGRPTRRRRLHRLSRAVARVSRPADLHGVQRRAAQALAHDARLGSILRFIENDIGAPPLGSADLDFGGDALSDFYTLGPAVTITPIPVSVLAAHSRAPMSRKFWRDQPPEAGDDY